MTGFTFLFLANAFAMFLVSAGHSPANKSHVQDKDHLKEHLQGVVDLDKMTDEDLKFYYFKVHDVEGNDKLDGIELVQSLLHFHAEESSTYGYVARTLTDEELSMMIDPVLKSDDKNMDGFIDYSEFISGQISRDF